jgi:hypothetical protein
MMHAADERKFALATGAQHAHSFWFGDDGLVGDAHALGVNGCAGSRASLSPGDFLDGEGAFDPKTDKCSGPATGEGRRGWPHHRAISRAYDIRLTGNQESIVGGRGLPSRWVASDRSQSRLLLSLPAVVGGARYANCFPGLQLLGGTVAPAFCVRAP